MFAYQVGASEHEEVPINALKIVLHLHCVQKETKKIEQILFLRMYEIITLNMIFKYSFLKVYQK